MAETRLTRTPTQVRPPEQGLLGTDTGAPAQEESPEADPGRGAGEEARGPQRPRRVAAAAAPDALGRRVPGRPG